MIIDIHCHYVLTARPAGEGRRFSFEPVAGDGGAAAWDAVVSPRASRWWSSWVLRRLLGVDGPSGAALDARLAAVYARHLRGAGPIEQFVLLAFDYYHCDDGRPVPLPERARQRGSDVYTSNSLVAGMCRDVPERFRFGASIHPYRRNALECVDEVAAAGACLLKWLPLHQNIDIADRRSLAVLRKCAALGLPVLAHYGPEFTLATNHREHMAVTAALEALRKLRREGTMPVFIVAHAATPITPFGAREGYEALLAALAGEFSDAPLFADVSALTALGKVGFLRELAARTDLHHKLLFGSDFPIPIGWPRLAGRLGRGAARGIRQEQSWPQQAVHILRRMGFSEIVFHRAAQLLASRGGVSAGVARGYS